MVKKAGLLVLLMGLSGIASASESCKVEYFFWFPIDVCSSSGGEVGRGGSSPKAAPEIDPGSAMAGLTLAMGGLAVL
jgi:hypothetical protein